MNKKVRLTTTDGLYQVKGEVNKKITGHCRMVFSKCICGYIYSHLCMHASINIMYEKHF